MGGNAYFAGDRLNGERTLWEVAPGSESATDKLGENQTVYGDHLAAVGSRVFFGASGPLGTELYACTAGGTALVKDIAVKPPGLPERNSLPSALTAAGGLVYFIADDGETGTQLYRSDGSAAGTIRLTNFPPGGGPDIPREIAAWPTHETVYFYLGHQPAPIVLWKSSGSVATTAFVPNAPNHVHANPVNIRFVSATEVYFSAHGTLNAVERGQEPWHEIMTAWPTGSISGKTWMDTNGNGIRNVGEPALANIGVTLYSWDGTAILSKVTNANGEYTFNNLPPGRYFVSFSKPTGLAFTAQVAGGDSDANMFGITEMVFVDPNATVANVDAGYVSL